MIGICTAFILLLLTVTQCVPLVAMCVIPYGYPKSLKISGILGGGSAADKTSNRGVYHL